MAYAAKVILDSLAPCGIRLTTLELTFPRMILAEFNTHRVFSRNSASSRAIPVKKQLEKVMTDPFIPVHWGKNEKGMSASEQLTDREKQKAIREWLRARDNAVTSVQTLAIDMNVHKQIANRLLEPFMWHTVVVTATDWDNFWNQRRDKNAQPEMQVIARMAKDVYDFATPQEMGVGEWHLPYLQPDERGDILEDWQEISAARCARVSYLTQDGKRDVAEDYMLYQRLVAGFHMSPLEHPAMALDEPIRLGNFVGWKQLRKTIPNEHCAPEPELGEWYDNWAA